MRGPSSGRMDRKNSSCSERGFVLDCLTDSPMEQSELLLRNKVDNKVEEPVFCKKAGKAQSVSTFYMGRRVHGFDWHRGSSSQVGSLKSSGTLCGMLDCEAI